MSFNYFIVDIWSCSNTLRLLVQQERAVPFRHRKLYYVNPVEWKQKLTINLLFNVLHENSFDFVEWVILKRSAAKLVKSLKKLPWFRHQSYWGISETGKCNENTIELHSWKWLSTSTASIIFFQCYSFEPPNSVTVQYY